MADVVMEMETGQFVATGDPAPAPEKSRGPKKYSHVPPEMLERARAMELVKQELAHKRKAAGDDYNLAMYKERKALCTELSALWIEIRATQKVAVVAHRAKERLKQTVAAEKKARFLGNAT